MTIDVSTASYTLAVPTDATNVVNNTITLNVSRTATGSCAIQLPAISTFGNSPTTQIIINDSGLLSGTNNITVTCHTDDKINNAATFVLAVNGGQATLEVAGGNDWIGINPQGGYPQVAITANADGLTTAIIPNGNCHVNVTSSNAAFFVTLPAPIPGTTVILNVGANGYKLRSNAPATVAINGGTGASVSSAVGANILLRLYCNSATTWISTSFTTAGVVAAGAVAA